MLFQGSFIDQALTVVVILIMFGIGATLKMADFRHVFTKPKALIWGLFLQLVFLPLFTFGILHLFHIDPIYCIGFMVVAFCPGGTTSNFISYVVNANVALSIGMTSINSIIILATIPIGTNFAMDYFLQSDSSFSLPIIPTFIQIFVVLMLPVIAGMLFNHKCSSLSEKIRYPLKIINIILLGVVFSAKFFGDKASGGSGITSQEVFTLLPYALLIQIGSMLISFFIVRLRRFSSRNAVTIGIEVGLQNTTLAILVTTTLLNSDPMSKPALVYAVFSFFTTLLFAYLVRLKW